MNETKESKGQVKNSLRGFAKGWTIFMIVYTSAAAGSALQYLNNPRTAGLVILPFLGFCGMVLGSVFLLKKRPSGLWIMAGCSLLVTLLSGSSSGGYILISSGGIVFAFLSWLFTRKQIDFGHQKRQEDYTKEIQVPIVQEKEEHPVPVVEQDVHAQDKAKADILKAAKPQPEIQQAAPPIPKIKKTKTPVPNTQNDAPVRKTAKPEPTQPKGKANWYLIGGVAVFAVIICVILVLMLIRPANPTTTVQYADISSTAAAWTPVQSVNAVSKPAFNEQPVLEDIGQKLSQYVMEQGKQLSNDSLFLAAIKNVKFEKSSFTENNVEISLLLPDPKVDSLKQLDIKPYVPYSGAQAYLQVNYAKLLQVNTLKDTAAFDANLLLQSVNGEKTVDWSFPSFMGALEEYRKVFKANMEKYMTDMGFFIAAKEILMPDFQNWPAHMGQDTNPEYLRNYFKNLADALAEKGIQHKGKLTIDAALIQQLLEKRMKAVWAFDLLAVKSDNYNPSLAINTFTHVSFFTDVYEKLDAKYRSGQINAPATWDALEEVYVSLVKEKVNSMYGDLAKGNGAIVRAGNYSFDWEKLGTQGISACPDLVSEIRVFMDAYDFSLMFLGNINGLQ